MKWIAGGARPRRGVLTRSAPAKNPGGIADAVVVFDPSDHVPRPARSIPPHFSSVSEATRDDFERVFGAEDG